VARGGYLEKNRREGKNGTIFITRRSKNHNTLLYIGTLGNLRGEETSVMKKSWSIEI